MRSLFACRSALPLFVDISDVTRRNILHQFATSSLTPPLSLFDAAQGEVLNVLQSEIYPAFLYSREYAQLLESGKY